MVTEIRATMIDRKRRNPLIIDPDDYEKLFDDEFREDDLDDRAEEYEVLSFGARRKKPAVDHDL
jgi:hypothetical protein